MRQPLQALLIAGEEMARATIQGKKRISIREGHREYRAGEKIILCCPDIGWSAQAEVESVCWTSMENVPMDDIHDDGFVTREEAINVLRTWYPDFHRFSLVTVIRWRGVTGGRERGNLTHLYVKNN